MAELIDRYRVEVSPTKRLSTQKREVPRLDRLRKTFGDSRVGQIKPKHVFLMRDSLHRYHGASTANLHVSLLSHMFTKAIEWGLTDYHPVIGKVRKIPMQPERRLIADWKIDEALKAAPPLIDCYVRLKLMLGLRRTDMLALQWPSIKEDGIHVLHSKTAHSSGRQTVYEWDQEGVLRGVVDEIRQLQPRVRSMYLFSTRRGAPYLKPDATCPGFSNIWQRWMRKALAETGLQQRFKERWLRTKVGSESASEQEAADRLGHASTATTRKHYREAPTKVSPLVKK